jgi:hypothetical protein
MNALQIVYVVVLGWLVFSTLAWGASQTDREPFTWRQCALWTPVFVAAVAALFAAIGGVGYLLVYIGGLLG